MRNWLFKMLFPREYEHFTHLVDDVIALEMALKARHFQTGIYCDSNNSTIRMEVSL